MRSKEYLPDKESSTERGSRFLRNVNVATGAGALALVASGVLAPPLAAGATAFAGINALQAGGFEWLRRRAKNKRRRKSKGKTKS